MTFAEIQYMHDFITWKKARHTTQPSQDKNSVDKK
jgi:hypothetical protein